MKNSYVYNNNKRILSKREENRSLAIDGSRAKSHQAATGLPRRGTVWVRETRPICCASSGISPMDSSCSSVGPSRGARILPGVDLGVLLWAEATDGVRFSVFDFCAARMVAVDSGDGRGYLGDVGQWQNDENERHECVGGKDVMWPCPRRKTARGLRSRGKWRQ
jgi:hypothetical protein